MDAVGFRRTEKAVRDDVAVERPRHAEDVLAAPVPDVDDDLAPRTHPGQTT